MSKSITEKELAEKLKTWHGRNWEQPDWYWRNLARASAEATGYEFAPEKPEPGTWHFTENGSPARVNWDGSLHAYYPDGEFDILHDDSDWPALIPARVVPAEQVELSKAEVGALWDAVNVSRLEWKGYSGVFHEQVTATVDAALDKHGHGRAEVTREKVRAGVDSACSDLFFSEEFKEMLTTRLTSALLGGT